MNRPESMEKFYSQKRQDVAAKQSYESSPKKKQLRFDTDEVYLSYLGKSSENREANNTSQHSGGQTSSHLQAWPRDEEIERRIKEAKVNLEWKIALKLK